MSFLVQGKELSNKTALEQPTASIPANVPRQVHRSLLVTDLTVNSTVPPKHNLLSKAHFTAA